MRENLKVRHLKMESFIASFFIVTWSFLLCHVLEIVLVVCILVALTRFQ